MYYVQNNHTAPLGIPGARDPIQPGHIAEVSSEALAHHVIRNWVSSGKLKLRGRKTSPPAPEVSELVADLIKESVPTITELLPDLTDEEFDQLVRLEKAGKDRKTLNAAFADEWERRFG